MTAEERLQEFETLRRLMKQDIFSKQDLRDIYCMCKESPASEQLAPLAGLAFISNKPLSEKELEHGRELAKTHGWLND